MKIYNWTNFLENRNYDNPPDFDKEQVDWLSHSINNPNNFIKNFTELSLDVLEDEINDLEEEDLDIVRKNLKTIKKHSKDIENRIVNLQKSKVKSE